MPSHSGTTATFIACRGSSAWTRTAACTSPESAVCRALTRCACVPSPPAHPARLVVGLGQVALGSHPVSDQSTLCTTLFCTFSGANFPTDAICCLLELS